jgi:hypothetical protein
MKKLLSTLCLVLASPAILASCDDQNIIYRSETSIGISIGKKGTGSSFGENQSINVPLSINGLSGCYKKVNAFQLKANDSSKGVSKGKITITPLEVEFDNIPNPSAKQYIFVEKNANKLQTKFHTLSFICSGELPLSIESTSDSYQKIIAKSQSVNYTQIIAIGAAAKNFGTNNQSYSQDTFNFFLNLYQQKTGKTLAPTTPSFNHNIPDIISETSIHALSNVDRKITSSFLSNSTNIPNGCSKEFSDSMNQ